MSTWTDGGNLVPNSGRRTRTGISRTVVEVIRYIETTAEITGGKTERILDKENLCLQAGAIYIYIQFRQPVKEKILSEGTRQKAKYCHCIFSLSLSISLSLSLSLFKERRRKKKRKNDIYIYVLSADNIADTVNIWVRVCIKKIVIF